VNVEAPREVLADPIGVDEIEARGGAVLHLRGVRGLRTSATVVPGAVVV
jgi:hypothetical protein